MSVELLPHSADIAIKSVGSDFHNSLSELVRGLGQIMGTTFTEQLEREIPLPTQDAQSIVKTLSEALWMWEESQHVPVGLKIDDGKCQLLGSPLQHADGMEVKAITYHELSFGQTSSGFEILVIVDI